MNASQSPADADTQRNADSPFVTIGGHPVRTEPRSSEPANRSDQPAGQISIEAQPAEKPSIQGTLRTCLRNSNDARATRCGLFWIACFLAIGGVVLTLVLCERSCARRRSL